VQPGEPTPEGFELIAGAAALHREALALRRALIRVLVARAGHPDHRSALAARMHANGLGPSTWAPGAPPAPPAPSRAPERVPARRS
jgi:hypothetical protein